MEACHGILVRREVVWGTRSSRSGQDFTDYSVVEEGCVRSTLGCTDTPAKRPSHPL
jgi:hypothetical protein